MSSQPHRTPLSRRSVLFGSAAIGVGGLSGCAPGAAAAPDVDVDIAEGPPSADAVSVPAGAVQRAIEQLPELVSELFDRAGVPGLAVAVVHGGRTAYTTARGVRSLDARDRVDKNTVFPLASLSKPLGATVVAHQIGRGVVAWSDPVQRHFPEFALADPWVSEHVTIGDLYAHRSGLPHAAGDDLEDLGYERATILERLRQLPLTAFRASYAYANFGITAGAEAVARAAETPWAELSRRVLYEPLGMTATSSLHSDYLAAENRALLHTWRGDGFAAEFDRNADEQSPAGGVSSSVADVARWMRLLLARGEWQGEQVVDAAALLAATSPQSASSPPSSPDDRGGAYGFGFNSSVWPGGRTVFGHSGAFALGAGTNAQFVPSLDVAIVCLTNAAPIGLAEAVTSSFLDLVQYGRIRRDWFTILGPLFAPYREPAGDLAGEAVPPNAAPGHPLTDYVGRFTNAYFGDAVVATVDSGLELRLGPGNPALPLIPWGGDTFAVEPRSENANEGSRSSVVFADARGSMRIAIWDDHGLGTWQRVAG